MFAGSKKVTIFAFPNHGAVAQMVEQWTENPCVGSSILPSTTCNPLIFSGLSFLFSLSFSLFAKPTILKSTLLYATKSCPHSALRPIFSENRRLLYCLNR